MSETNKADCGNHSDLHSRYQDCDSLALERKSGPSELLLAILRTLLAASTIYGFGMFSLVEYWSAHSALIVAITSIGVMLTVLALCRRSRPPESRLSKSTRFLYYGWFAPAFAVFLCASALFLQLDSTSHDVAGSYSGLLE